MADRIFVPCRAAATATVAYPAVSCRSMKRLGELILRAFRASSLGGCEPNPHLTAVVCAIHQCGEEWYCRACRARARERAEVRPPDPAMLELTTTRLLDRIESTWAADHYGGLEKNDKPTAREARAILARAIVKRAREEGLQR